MHAGRLVLRGFLGAATVAALAGALVGTATAEPDVTDSGTTDAHVGVDTAIALTGLTADFTLSGVPGATVTGPAAVTFNVETNNLAGYSVTVQSQTADMTPETVGNGDSVPIGALSVRETAVDPDPPGAFTPLSSTGTVPVHTQDERSAENGDSLSNDYQVVIPFVNEDTYSATLDYIATTL